MKPDDFGGRELFNVLTDLIGKGKLEMLPQASGAYYTYIYRDETVKVAFGDASDFLYRIYLENKK